MKSAESDSFEHLVHETSIRFEATHVGADFAWATDGQIPSMEEMRALYRNDFLNFSPGEIILAFDSEAIFQEETARLYSDQKWEKWRRNQFVLKEIEASAADGLLPPVFFMKIERTYSQERLDDIQDNGHRKSHDVGLISDERAEPEELMRRYARFMLVHRLLPGISDARKLNMALGYNVETGSLIMSSLIGEIRKHDEFISAGFIESTASGMGIFDYIYPALQQKHHANLRQATGVTEATEEETYPEHYYDITTGSTLAGRAAIELALMNGSAANGEIIPLADVLLGKSPIAVKRGHEKRVEYDSWTDGEFLAYGTFLLRILALHGAGLDSAIIGRAASAGLGPGLAAIESRFDGSIVNFFRAIGQETRNAKNEFSELTREEAVEYVREVAAQNDGNVSESILRQNYRKMRSKGVAVPSPSQIKSSAGAIGHIIEQAGFKIAVRKKNREDCVAGGVRFYEENGRLPVVKDIIETDYLASWPTTRRYCGNLGDFHALIEQELLALQEEYLEMAA